MIRCKDVYKSFSDKTVLSGIDFEISDGEIFGLSLARVFMHSPKLIFLDEPTSGLVIMAVGFVISILAGACIGIFSKNQMAATSVVMPVMLIFAFSPMLAMFNESIEKVVRFAYTEQLKRIMDDMTFSGIKTDNICILGVNAMLMAVLFFITFRKKVLE